MSLFSFSLVESPVLSTLSSAEPRPGAWAKNGAFVMERHQRSLQILAAVLGSLLHLAEDTPIADTHAIRYLFYYILPVAM